MSRGAEFGRNHAWPEGLSPTIFAYATALEPVSAQILEHGVAAVTAEDIRWARRDIKSTALLANVLLKKLAVDAGRLRDHTAGRRLSHGRIVDDGSRHHRRHDPHAAERPADPSGNDARRGRRTRRSGSAYRARLRVTEAELRAADEIWLAFSTRGVLPVTRLDGAAVGSGVPGPLFRRMHAAFDAYVGELAGTPAL